MVLSLWYVFYYGYKYVNTPKGSKNQRCGVLKNATFYIIVFERKKTNKKIAVMQK
jgi:hypothetical protein